jgi:hypothetical protein
MLGLRFSGLPFAVLLVAGAAVSQEAPAQQASLAPVRLVVFEDFMRPT